MRWGKVTIIGVGLLGGSIGLALRRRKLAREVCGFVRRPPAVRTSLRAGAVTTCTTDLRAAVADAELVVLCTPVAEMSALCDRMLPVLKRGVLVTDVGSVKAPVVRALGARIRRVGGAFIGSHPMAGSERGGVRAARPDLFEGSVCVLTPDGRAQTTALTRVTRFWRALGARVLVMTAAEHDRVVARTSHLPHVMASLLVNQVLDPRQDRRQAQLSASGFRDTTRIACSSPRMWRDIVMANRGNLLRDLARFEARLADLRACLAAGDGDRLERLLTQAQALRSAWGEGRPGLSEE